jgi:hypothetical protein
MNEKIRERQKETRFHEYHVRQLPLSKLEKE